MSRGVNKAIIVGNLGADPEIRHTQSGGEVANLSVATSEKWKDKATGEDREETTWHRVVAFGRLAEIMGEYLNKGSQVYVEGRLQTRKWQDKQGNDRYTTEIVAHDMQMLGSKGDAPAAEPESNHQDTQAAYAKASGGNTRRNRKPPAPVTAGDDPEDEIPF